jgi:hypothetical protein
MISPIWKAPDGGFFTVQEPTQREIKIMTMLGCKQFQTPAEFIRSIDQEMNRKPFQDENFQSNNNKN